MDVPLQKLCNADDDIKIKFLVKVNKKDSCYGITTLRECKDETWVEEGLGPRIVLRSVKGEKPCGALRLLDFKITEYPNFAEYLAEGLQMSLTVAIDFSASNGQVYNPPSGRWKYKKKKIKD